MDPEAEHYLIRQSHRLSVGSGGWSAGRGARLNASHRLGSGQRLCRSHCGVCHDGHLCRVLASSRLRRTRDCGGYLRRRHNIRSSYFVLHQTGHNLDVQHCGCHHDTALCGLFHARPGHFEMGMTIYEIIITVCDAIR